MDWEGKSLDWNDGNFANFCYGLRETTVVTKLASNNKAGAEVRDISPIRLEFADNEIVQCFR